MRARVDVAARGGKTHRRGRNLFLNVLAQGGLVVFDREQIVGSVFQNQFPGGLVLGVQGVQRDGAPGQIQFPEELARHRDFIGFGSDQRTAQIELAGDADRAQEGIARAMVGLLAIDYDQVVRGAVGRALGSGWPARSG